MIVQGTAVLVLTPPGGSTQQGGGRSCADRMKLTVVQFEEANWGGM